MPGLPLVVDLDNREEPGRQQLLAVWKLRRDLEHVPPCCAAQRREPVALTLAEVVRELYELIAAPVCR